MSTKIDLFCCNCHTPKAGDLLELGPDHMHRCPEHHKWLMEVSPTGGLRKAWYLRTGPFKNDPAGPCQEYKYPDVTERRKPS